MDDKKPPFEYGPDAPDLAHQMIADVYRSTGDKAFRWAQDELHAHRAELELREAGKLMHGIVTHDAATPKADVAAYMQTLDPMVWRPYAEYLLTTKEPLPLDARHMLELSIATTAALQAYLGHNLTGKYSYHSEEKTPLPQVVRDAVHIEFWSAQEHYCGNGQHDPHKYDRDAVPVLFIDRPRLYEYLSTLPSPRADAILSRLSTQLSAFQDYQSNGFVVRWRHDGSEHSMKDLAKAMEEYVPASREEERRFKLDAWFKHTKGEYVRTASYLEEFGSVLRLAKLEVPIALKGYSNMLQADRDAFRYDAITAKARPVAPTSLLDLMGQPPVEGDKVRRLLEDRATPSACGKTPG